MCTLPFFLSLTLLTRWKAIFFPTCECLAAVFGKLGCHERNTCSLACRRWRAVDSKSRQRLVLLARSEASPFLPALLCRFSSVSVLSLKCSRKIVSIDDQALARIPTLLASLKKLKLKGCIDVTDDGLHAFSLHRPPLLTKLSFAFKIVSLVQKKLEAFSSD